MTHRHSHVHPAVVRGLGAGVLVLVLAGGAAVAPTLAYADQTGSEITPGGGAQSTDIKTVELQGFTFTGRNISASDFYYDAANQCVYIRTQTPLTVSGGTEASPLPTGLWIERGYEVNLTLNNVHVSSAGCAMYVMPGATANLILADESTNTFTTTHASRPGIRVIQGSTLTVDDAVANKDQQGIAVTPSAGVVSRDATVTYTKSDGTTELIEVKAGDPLSRLDSPNPGTLIAWGKNVYGAGIGGGWTEDGGSMTFNGGIVKAYSGTSKQTSNATSDNGGGAGIGGGKAAAGTAPGDAATPADWIVINGGIIEAHGSYHGAGIGGGWNQNETSSDAVVRSKNPCGTGNIAINGGYIISMGGNDGNGFGRGCYGGCVTSDNSVYTILMTGGTMIPTGGTNLQQFGNAIGGTGITGSSDAGRLVASMQANIYITGGSIQVDKRSNGQLRFDGTAYAFEYPETVGPTGEPLVYTDQNGVKATLKDEAGEQKPDPAGNPIYLDLAGNPIVDDLGYSKLNSDGSLKKFQVTMVAIDLTGDLQDQTNKNNKLESWEIFVGGQSYAYGAPAQLDNGNVYVWLPTSASNQEVEVQLTYREKDAEGNDIPGQEGVKEVLPLFKDASGAHSGGENLKRYDRFVLDDAWWEARNKRYDGLPLASLDLASNPIVLTDAQTLTDSSKLTYTAQRFSAPGGSALESQQSASNTMPSQAGTHRITINSTEYSTDATFSASYWGHRAEGWAQIDKADTQIEISAQLIGTTGGTTAVDGSFSWDSDITSLAVTAEVTPRHTVREDGSLDERYVDKDGNYYTRVDQNGAFSHFTDADGNQATDAAGNPFKLTDLTPLSEARTCETPQGTVVFKLNGNEIGRVAVGGSPAVSSLAGGYALSAFAASSTPTSETFQDATYGYNGVRANFIYDPNEVRGVLSGDGEQELTAEFIPVTLGNYNETDPVALDKFTLFNVDYAYPTDAMPRDAGIRRNNNNRMIYTKPYDGTAGLDEELFEKYLYSQIPADERDNVTFSYDSVQFERAAANPNGTYKLTFTNFEVNGGGIMLMAADDEGYGKIGNDLVLEARILPAPLTIATTTSHEVIEEKKAADLTFDWEPVAGSDLHSADLASGMTVADVVGTPSFTATSGQTALNPVNPQLGTYNVMPNFAGVSGPEMSGTYAGKYLVGNYAIEVLPAQVHVQRALVVALPGTLTGVTDAIYTYGEPIAAELAVKDDAGQPAGEPTAQVVPVYSKLKDGGTEGNAADYEPHTGNFDVGSYSVVYVAADGTSYAPSDPAYFNVQPRAIELETTFPAYNFTAGVHVAADGRDLAPADAGVALAAGSTLGYDDKLTDILGAVTKRDFLDSVDGTVRLNFAAPATGSYTLTLGYAGLEPDPANPGDATKFVSADTNYWVTLSPAELTFETGKANVAVSVTAPGGAAVAGTTVPYGGSYKSSASVAGVPLTQDVSFEYEVKTGDTWELFSGRPAEPGTYRVRAMPVSTDLEMSDWAEFVIQGKATSGQGEPAPTPEPPVWKTLGALVPEVAPTVYGNPVQVTDTYKGAPAAGTITHEFYVQNGADWLPISGEPQTPGTYKVVSKGTNPEGLPYAAGEAQFVVASRQLLVQATYPKTTLAAGVQASEVPSFALAAGTLAAGGTLEGLLGRPTYTMERLGDGVAFDAQAPEVGVYEVEMTPSGAQGTSNGDGTVTYAIGGYRVTVVPTYVSVVQPASDPGTGSGDPTGGGGTGGGTEEGGGSGTGTGEGGGGDVTGGGDGTGDGGTGGGTTGGDPVPGSPTDPAPGSIQVFATSIYYGDPLSIQASSEEAMLVYETLTPEGTWQPLDAGAEPTQVGRYRVTATEGQSSSQAIFMILPRRVSVSAALMPRTATEGTAITLTFQASLADGTLAPGDELSALLRAASYAATSNGTALNMLAPKAGTYQVQLMLGTDGQVNSDGTVTYRHGNYLVTALPGTFVVNAKQAPPKVETIVEIIGGVPTVVVTVDGEPIPLDPAASGDTQGLPKPQVTYYELDPETGEWKPVGTEPPTTPGTYKVVTLVIGLDGEPLAEAVETEFDVPGTRLPATGQPVPALRKPVPAPSGKILPETGDPHLVVPFLAGAWASLAAGVASLFGRRKS